VLRAQAVFKQYREADGRFYFKFVDGERVLVQSIGFASPKDAGQLIARLKREGAGALRHAEADALHLGDELIGHLRDAAELADVVDALAQLVEEA
jgi:tryptophanyl-tRNA synthetase